MLETNIHQADHQNEEAEYQAVVKIQDTISKLRQTELGDQRWTTNDDDSDSQLCAAAHTQSCPPQQLPSQRLFS